MRIAAASPWPEATTRDPWVDTIPDKYAPGTVVTGKVTKITNFGVFVELEPDLEGLLHVSELAAHKVSNPEDEVQVGQDIEVRILRLDLDDRKIGLSRRLEGDIEPVAGEESGTTRPASAPVELKGERAKVVPCSRCRPANPKKSKARRINLSMAC
ncbi:MAG: S1 RNA-binding domain-containing protein [Planctomycetaceae bacterium]